MICAGFCNKIFYKLTLIIVLILFSFSSFGQSSKAQLESEKRKIENEINYTNKLLSSATSSKENSLEVLIILGNKIKYREQLISTISSEIDEFDRQIEIHNNIIAELESELVQLKKEYARLIYYAYKNKNSMDRLMYIFSAENFNQAFQRLKYLQYYSAYRKRQAGQIEQTKDSIVILNESIATNRIQKQNLSQSKQREIGVLNHDKSDQNKKVTQLLQQEKQLRATIRKKRTEAKRLNRAINDIIAAEIKATNNAKEAGTELRSGIALSPEELELTNSFSSNKGKLPWPSEFGIVSSTFGEHDHPVLKKVKIKNNGIDIITNTGEKARSIFGGKVISVRTITNTNKAVIIRHGEYFTVYSNLSSVYVQPGDNVETKQDIGLVYTDQAESKTELHFEIWKGKILLNPQYWVVK